MAKRPRLNLSGLYFVDSYKAEIECIDRHIELLSSIIENQIILEKTENNHLHQALNLSYTLMHRKQKDGWEYEDADKYIQDLIEKFQE